MIYILAKLIIGAKFTFLIKEFFKQIPTKIYERLPLRYVLAIKWY